VAVILHQNLFDWQDVESSSDLSRLQLVLRHIPDEEIVSALERQRGRGRDTYPIRPMWNALLAGIVFQHPTMESLLRELRRNAELRAVCGFNVIHGASAVPTSWAMSRFLRNVIKVQEEIEKGFELLVEGARELLPGFGEHLAFDGKAIQSFSTGKKSKKSKKCSDPDADWGYKSYRGVDKGGRPWEKIKKWFGYQLHLIVDSEYEIPVAYEIQRASTSEVSRIMPMIRKLEKEHPDLVKASKVLMADRGLDSGEVNRELWDRYRIKAVIDTRSLWEDEKKEQGRDPEKEITRVIDPDRVDTIVYTERGSVRCICPDSGQERKMAFWGFEAQRDSLKYRCPAAARGFICTGRAECEKMAPHGPTGTGRIVRVPLDFNRRIFTPIPRDTPTWNRL